jgi:hypothetical protein
MSKRAAGFQRRAQDFYSTPAKAVLPLLRHLPPRCRFVEPCAGDGALIRALESAGHICVQASDIELRAPNICLDNAATCELHEGSTAITNPPWAWAMLAPIIDNLSRQLPTWLLLDADFAHNVRAAPFMARCAAIVPVGRVQWIPESGQSGKQNTAWYRFEASPFLTIFHPRQAGAVPANSPKESN